MFETYSTLCTTAIERQAFITVLDPHVTTRGEAGHIVMTVLGMVAQMERRFIKERQREGIERAKADGVYRGGKRRLDLGEGPIYERGRPGSNRDCHCPGVLANAGLRILGAGD